MSESYPLHKLFWQQFEDLVVNVCQEKLGIAATAFEDGPDGGRDSTFEGTAKEFPSSNGAWDGKFIIQAKHSSDVTKSCSDKDFIGTHDKSVISKEIKKLIKLKSNGEIDNYIIFTNRKLTGNQHPKIVNRIKVEVGINNVAVIGRKQLCSILERMPHLLSKFSLVKDLYPIRFFESDIRDLIIAFNNNLSKIGDKAGELNDTYSYLEKEGSGNKNDLNMLGQDYFEYMKEVSISYFGNIDSFLRDPINKKYLSKYKATASDLKAKIILERKNYRSFENLIENLIDFVYERCGKELGSSRELVRVFIHFMYFSCDIGKTE